MIDSIIAFYLLPLTRIDLTFTLLLRAGPEEAPTVNQNTFDGPPSTEHKSQFIDQNRIGGTRQVGRPASRHHGITLAHTLHRCKADWLASFAFQSTLRAFVSSWFVMWGLSDDPRWVKRHDDGESWRGRSSGSGVTRPAEMMPSPNPIIEKPNGKLWPALLWRKKTLHRNAINWKLINHQHPSHPARIRPPQARSRAGP